MKLITCKNTGFTYDGKQVLRDINFEFDEECYLCIVGENGSGKSTLVKGILSLKSPSAGIIEFHNGFSASDIGYLPQQTRIQKDFPASVMEVVISGRLSSLGRRPFYRNEDRRIAGESLEMLAISNLEKVSYQSLSGGQQQRVLLARALCAGKRLLVLDEPVNGLDPIAKKEMYSLIKKLNKNNGISIIMISHDVRAAVENADKILHLAGRQLFFGKADEYRKSRIGRVFLDEGGADGAF